MKSDFDASNITEDSIDGIAFKTHKRFRQYYFNPDKAFEQQSTHHVLTNIRPGDTFVDIGAHHGYYCLRAAQSMQGQGTIYAFEPVPANRALLAENTKRMQVKDVFIKPEAVSDSVGTATFNIPWASDSAGLTAHPLADTLESIEVGVTTLDAMMGDAKVDFIKMDTEGNELHVLNGMTGVIKRNPGLRLLIEFNPECLRSAGTDPEALLERIVALGFDVYIVDEENRESMKLGAPSDWKKYTVDVNYRNLFCVPAGTPSVLLFTHSARLQGAERATVELAAALQDRGGIVTVSSPSDGPLNDLCASNNIAVARHTSSWWLDADKETFSQRTSQAGQTGIEVVIGRYNYDYVLNATSADPTVVAAATRLDKSLVQVVHEDMSRFTYPLPLHDVGVFLTEMADRIYVPSRSLGDKLADSIPGFKSARVIYPVAAPPAALRKDGKPNLIMVGSIEPNKNQADAIMALDILHAQGKQLGLTLVGPADREYRRTLQKIIKERKLERYVTFVPEAAVPWRYATGTSIYVSCSVSESFGRSVLEAMSLGLPVIVAESRSKSDFLVHGKNCLQYELGNSAALAKMIERALTRDRREMVREGHKTYDALRQAESEQVDELYAWLSRPQRGARAMKAMDLMNTLYADELAAAKKRWDDQHHVLEATLKDYAELIEVHQGVINSKAWKYATKLQHYKKILRGR